MGHNVTSKKQEQQKRSFFTSSNQLKRSHTKLQLKQHPSLADFLLKRSYTRLIETFKANQDFMYAANQYTMYETEDPDRELLEHAYKIAIKFYNDQRKQGFSS